MVAPCLPARVGVFGVVGEEKMRLGSEGGSEGAEGCCAVLIVIKMYLQAGKVAIRR